MIRPLTVLATIISLMNPADADETNVWFGSLAVNQMIDGEGTTSCSAQNVKEGGLYTAVLHKNANSDPTRDSLLILHGVSAARLAPVGSQRHFTENGAFRGQEWNASAQRVEFSGTWEVTTNPPLASITATTPFITIRGTINNYSGCQITFAAALIRKVHADK